MWQYLIVFCIVAAAALHAGTKYLPASWRQRAVYFLSRCGVRRSKMDVWFKTGKSADGCSNCSACAETTASENNAKRVVKLHVLPPK